jgi:hypothetical protein
MEHLVIHSIKIIRFHGEFVFAFHSECEVFVFTSSPLRGLFIREFVCFWLISRYCEQLRRYGICQERLTKTMIQLL